ncbi:hypothetical protein [Steroidobacter cummioxidans]|uniref:hypothetical protein n=1 Tax=Steroidobacter cummioxidans TaxID=1803913 RepID=UPI000E3230D8|nr:hypothetical protein [Steroidobacter cummioxidans]
MAQLNEVPHRAFAGARRWGRAFALACMFAGGMSIATSASAARTIRSLPFTETFDANNYSDIVWTTQGATQTWMPNAGYNGRGAAKFTGPNAEGYSAAGQFIFGMPTIPEQINIRVLVYQGRMWHELGAGGKLMILNRTGNRGRPMVIATDYQAGNWESWGACDGTVCRFEGGDMWPNGRERLRLGNNTQGNGKRSNEWISVELEANTRTGMIKLYIDTQDGALSGLYVERYMDDTGPGGTWSYIDLIGGYMNWGNVRADPENYFMLDDIVVNDRYIGPPAGFRTGTSARPNPPTSLSVQ